MNRYLKLVAWIAFLTICITIFMFSHQPAEQSSRVSKSVLHEVLILIIPNYAEMPQEEQAIWIVSCHKWIRSAAHFFLYLLWGFTFSCLLKSYSLRRKILVPIVIIGGLVYAVSDEIHQIFSSGRSAQLEDVCLDVLGVLTGLGCFLAVWCLCRLICRKRLS